MKCNTFLIEYNLVIILSIKGVANYEKLSTIIISRKI